MSSSVRIECGDCEQLLATLNVDRSVDIANDVSGLFVEGVSAWPSSYPRLACPIHGHREMFDLIGFHAMLERGEAPEKVRV
jgi:hypothetical protein